MRSETKTSLVFSSWPAAAFSAFATAFPSAFAKPLQHRVDLLHELVLAVPAAVLVFVVVLVDVVDGRRELASMEENGVGGVSDVTFEAVEVLVLVTRPPK